MSGNEAYRVLDEQEKYMADICKEYSVIEGPNGEEFILTEPEDRSWERDGSKVVKELNRLYNEIDELKLKLYEIAEGVYNG